MSRIAPDDYETPNFPGLYLFRAASSNEAIYLYHRYDIWRFTLFWTIIIFEGFYVAASGYAVVVQWRNWKMMCMVPVLYMVVAGAEAILAGTVVGLMYVFFFFLVCWDAYLPFLGCFLKTLLAYFQKFGGLIIVDVAQARCDLQCGRF